MAYHVHARGHICPICREERKPTGSAMIDCVQIGGKTMTEAAFDAELNFNPDDDSDAFWNKPGFEEKYLDVLDQKNTMAEYGDLPPIALDNHSEKVLTEALTKKE